MTEHQDHPAVKSTNPRQNRVTPFGEIVAVPERGTFFGNRGWLHDENGRIRRAWQGERWILCLLEFKDRKHPITAPDQYTGLFFLDEATGLAAGHRPCSECRHERFNAFRDALVAGNPGVFGPGRVYAEAIDARLHAERVNSYRSKQTFQERLDGLPSGVFVTLTGRDHEAFLVRGGELLSWSPGGYTKRMARPRGEIATVLTPSSTVGAIRAGYVPDVHDTA